MKFVELLKIIGAALGSITGICATIVAIFKPLRKGFVNWVVCNTGSANMAKQISEIEKMMKDHIGQDAQKAEDMKTLKEIRIGDTVKVVKLHGEGAIKRRIMDMGITKGVAIMVRKVAPLGDPIEINVRGYELSLRKNDAEMIEVE